MARVNELLRREVASELYRLLSNMDCDLSAITVTRVETSPNLRHAQVMVSIRDHEQERNRMLRLIRKQGREIQRHVNKYTKLKYTPRLNFVLDPSIEQGDRILDIISRMEAAEPGMEEPDESITEEPTA